MNKNNWIIQILIMIAISSVVSHLLINKYEEKFDEKILNMSMDLDLELIRLKCEKLGGVTFGDTSYVYEKKTTLDKYRYFKLYSTCVKNNNYYDYNYETGSFINKEQDILK